MGERRLCTAEVRGSNPLISTEHEREDFDDCRTDSRLFIVEGNPRVRVGENQRPGGLPGRFVSLNKRLVCQALNALHNGNGVKGIEDRSNGPTRMKILKPHINKRIVKN